MAILVGLTAEARLAAPLGCIVVAGGGSAAGAEAAVRQLIARGATGLISFGLAGGLDPSLRPGTLIVPEAVLASAIRQVSPLAAQPALPHVQHASPPIVSTPSGPPAGIPHWESFATDPALSARLGGATPHTILGGDTIATTADAKRRLWEATGAAAIDLESGAVARAAAASGLPFAVLRAICDPAGRDLPPAALTALNHQGAIGLLRVIASLAARPGQFGALMTLAADAAAARGALATRVAAIGQLSIST